MAQIPASTIKILSLFSGLLLPTSLFISVGENLYLNKSSGSGSAASIAFLNSSIISLSISFLINFNFDSLKLFSTSNFSSFGNGSSFFACSRSSLYHSILTPEV